MQEAYSISRREPRFFACPQEVRFQTGTETIEGLFVDNCSG